MLSHFWCLENSNSSLNTDLKCYLFSAAFLVSLFLPQTELCALGPCAFLYGSSQATREQGPLTFE
jgi:hypothetical protein